MARKNNTEELAIFGGECLFATPKSTSNLVRPDFEKFMAYSKVFFDAHQYTNNGALVRLLEQRLANFHRTEYCVAFCSGFWALVLAITALALKGKTEIIMPSLTYRRMADIAAWARLKPNFCEVDRTTLAMTATTARRCLNEDTALILGVHPIVNCCDIDGLVELSREQGIPLLFDSVESVYESTPSGKIGCFGDAEIFSLHASKLLNGFEGGYLTTDNAVLAERLALIRGFGFKGADHIVIPDGMNAKLNEIHAAMALASLDDLEDQVLRNRERYYTYKQLLAPIPGMRLVEFDERQQTSYKNIVVELLDGWPLTRSATLSILNAENILARAYYYPPLHLKSMDYDHVPAHLPGTDSLANSFMLLPCGHFISPQDIVEITGLLSMLSVNANRIIGRLQNMGVN